MMNFGMAFSKDFIDENPLAHINIKRPVYLRLLEFCQAKGWGTYVLTRKTYAGGGIFNGVWKFVDNGEFEAVKEPVKIDLVYDRSAGVSFPPEGDEGLVWVNRRDFKVLAWDKWAAYQVIGGYMPQTIFLESEKELPEIRDIKTDWVVLKPFNGLKGLGIFIGPKENALKFNFNPKYKKYIAQEFVDTSDGIPGITMGLHDLRVAIVNGKIVWSHVRIPQRGSFKANAASGGTLIEIDLELIPENIKAIALKIAEKFKNEYDNPIYSLDFGIGKDGRPLIFEINDQIGFPKWEMKNRDNFLRALVKNFENKLSR